MDPDTSYWFPAKRHGWGWGLPVAWQGWLVLAVFLVLVAVGAFLFPPRTHTAGYVAYIVILCAALTAVCWLKGEPPRWRWGGDRSA
jgi:nitrate/nitrite transporter NarK